MINIQEIVIVNAAGIINLIVLLLSRYDKRKVKHFSDRLFNVMIAVTFIALIAETVSFIIDGKQGVIVRILQYVLNGYLFLASSGVGMVWVIYVYLRIFRNWNLIKKRIIYAALPFAAVVVSVIADFFGTGLLFYVTEDNVYHRGSIVMLPYIVVFIYYIASLVFSAMAVNKNNHVRFFPTLYFVIPCLAGTIVQNLNYGLSVGWFCVSLAFMFVQMQLCNQNAYIDDLSGLYNRKYYDSVIDRLNSLKRNKTISGIMIDVDQFKCINDQFGHVVGDNAIVNLGKIITGVVGENDMAFRHAGDEFIIISTNITEEMAAEIVERLEKAVDEFNEASGKLYRLSLSIGYVVSSMDNFDPEKFLHEMDMRMYEKKNIRKAGGSSR